MQKVSKIIFTILIFLATSLASKLLYGFFAQKNIDQNINQNNKILISASFYPLYFFSQEIAKDRAEVTNLTKSGVEPHDFEPSTKDIQTIENSKLLIANGLLFESWLNKFNKELERNKTEVLKVGELIPEKELIFNEDEEYDPHTWLDPVLAKMQVQIISNKLKEIDPSNIDFYEKNSQELITKLEELDLEFRNGLSNCQNKEIITSHAAFAYLAKRYNFKQIAVQGLNPDEDPSPARIAEIVKIAREKNINYIFFENLVSPKISEVIAKEVNAKTLIFDPLEGLSKENELSGKNYFSIQKENLANLKVALNCQ